MTWVNSDGTIGYNEPIPTATAVTLATQIEARVKFALRAQISGRYPCDLRLLSAILCIIC